MNNLIALVGLGAVGGPLADLLFKKYGKDFILLSSKNYLSGLNDLYINGSIFNPKIVYKRGQLKKKIGVVFICVKNYQIDAIAELLHKVIDSETVIVPLQNGVYSCDFFKEQFPQNIVLEGFAQGPNTTIVKNVYIYQKPGKFHIGSSNPAWCKKAQEIVEVMVNAEVESYYDKNIKYAVWKKLMLNVAGNAITALTGIDYCMFKQSLETQTLCKTVMNEFVNVANSLAIPLTEQDIQDTINYFLSFKVSKKTSMLEDVINCRPTENDYIAGYISKLAMKLCIDVPHIDTLYSLVKIKEDVYLKKI